MKEKAGAGPIAPESQTIGVPELAAGRDQLVGQLTSGVAHDFNNILATVLGCLELMERRVGDPDRLRVLIQRASDAVERAAELTSALVQFARRQPEPAQAHSINDVVASLTPLISSALGRRVRLETDLAHSAPLVQADLAGLSTIVLALCLSARRALPEGGHIRITTGEKPQLRITASGEEMGDCDLRIIGQFARALSAEVSSRTLIDNNTTELALYFPTASATRHLTS